MNVSKNRFIGIENEKNRKDLIEQYPYENSSDASSAKKIVSAEPKKSKEEDTLIPAALKKDEPSYFWSTEECIDFIKQLHAHGKKWKVISKYLQKRDALQCRSHGQKYLKAMEEL